MNTTATEAHLAHDTVPTWRKHSRTPLNHKLSVERLNPDFLRGRGKSIGGDLNVDEEESEQNERTNPCNHYTMAPLVINPCTHKLTLPRSLILASAIEKTSKNEKDAI
jgi:hypothetical protein